uniref:Uncharacterized protein n=1 Tax=Solanum lycopersicum TaxID=4081 RepID=A0A3Q7GTA3_SOLLC
MSFTLTRNSLISKSFFPRRQEQKTKPNAGSLRRSQACTTQSSEWLVRKRVARDAFLSFFAFSFSYEFQLQQCRARKIVLPSVRFLHVELQGKKMNPSR